MVLDIYAACANFYLSERLEVRGREGGEANFVPRRILSYGRLLVKVVVIERADNSQSARGDIGLVDHQSNKKR